jgi:signal transduction protein with GAF and PtsI domain
MYLMDKGGRSLSLAASRGVDTTGLERVGITEGFTGKAARSRSFIAQYVSDLEDRKRAAMLLGKGFKIVVCVPLMHMDQVLGVMNLGADRSMRLSKAKIDLLVAVGNAIAVAVNHSRLCDELARNLKVLKEKKETIEFFTTPRLTTSRVPWWAFMDWQSSWQGNTEICSTNVERPTSNRF